MKTLHLSIFTGIMITVLLFPISMAFAQYPQNLPHQIVPPPPDKIGCYNYTKETGWVSTPCANTSSPVSMGPGPVENSSKRFDISVGFSPINVAVNSNTHMIYVAHTPGNSVSVISGATNKVVSVIKVETDPWHVAVNPSTNMIYASNSNSHSVSAISGLTNKVVATIQVGSTPHDIIINPETDTVYVANEDSRTISVISGETNTVVSTVPVCNLQGAASTFAINLSTNTIYVTCTGPEGAIDVISGTTNKLVDTIHVGLDPTNVVINPSTYMLYTANNGDYTVSVVSAKTDKVVSTIPVEIFPNVIAVNPVTNMVYVASDGNDSHHKLSIISGATNKVVDTIDVASAYNVAIDSANDIIYLVNYESNSISVIAGNTNKVIDTIPVGAAPTSIVIDNVTKAVYVANWKSDFVSLIPFSNLDLQAVPEFPFAIPLLLVSFTSVIIFYRMKFRK